MPMREPWDLAQAFIAQQGQQAAQARATADTALLRMFATQTGRIDAGTAQGYALDTLAKRNEYSTAADTTQFGRQKELAGIQHDYSVGDAGTAQSNRMALQTADNAAAMERVKYSQDQENARAAMQYGTIDGIRRFGTLTPTDNKIIHVESAGNPNADNPTSSAAGLGQITNSTWEGLRVNHPELGLTPGGQKDRAQSERAIPVLRGEIQAHLQRNGIPVNDATTYAGWFLGAQGAVQALRNPDGAAMADVVGPGVIQANPFLRGMTVGGFKQWLSQKMGGASGVSGASTADAASGVRRYAGDVPDPTGQSAVGVQNTASSVMQDDGSSTVPVSKPFQDWLNDTNQEAVERIPLTEAQLALLPQEMRDQLVPDMYDTSTANGKKAATAYIVVRSRNEAENGQPSVIPAAQASRQTEAKPLPVVQQPRPVFKNGRRWVMQDGTDIQLPD